MCNWFLGRCGAFAPPAIVVGVLLVAGAQTQADVILSDSTFAPASWSTTAAYSGNGGNVSSGQSVSGGNPDSYWLVSQSVANAGAEPSIVHGRHISAAMVYDPGATGAVESLSFTTDLRTTGGQVGVGFAIEQAGDLFYGGYVIYSSVAWQPGSSGLLTEGDFIPLTGGVLDFSATGAPMKFGYFTANSNAAFGGGYSTTVGLDNFSVTISIPEPGTAALVGLGGIAVMRRRRL